MFFVKLMGIGYCRVLLICILLSFYGYLLVDDINSGCYTSGDKIISRRVDLASLFAVFFANKEEAKLFQAPTGSRNMTD